MNPILLRAAIRFIPLALSLGARAQATTMVNAGHTALLSAVNTSAKKAIIVHMLADPIRFVGFFPVRALKGALGIHGRPVLENGVVFQVKQLANGSYTLLTGPGFGDAMIAVMIKAGIVICIIIFVRKFTTMMINTALIHGKHQWEAEKYQQKNNQGDGISPYLL